MLGDGTHMLHSIFSVHYKKKIGTYRLILIGTLQKYLCNLNVL